MSWPGASGQPARSPPQMTPWARGQGFDDVAALGDAAIGQDTHAFLLGRLGANVEGGELRNTDTGDDSGGANGARTLSNLNHVCSAFT